MRGRRAVATVFAPVIVLGLVGVAAARPAAARPAAEVSAAASPTASARPAAAATPPSSDFVAVPHVRVFDTRRATHARPAPHKVSIFTLLERNGLPDTGVSAAALNVTVTAPQARGYLTVRTRAKYAEGTAPTTSTVNFVAGQTASNQVIVAPGFQDWIDLYNGSSGVLDVVIDLLGYYPTSGATDAGSFAPLTSTRVLDTRSRIGASRPAAHGSVNVAVLGHGGVPAGGVNAVVLNLTATDSGAGGYATAYPTGRARPTASSVNYVAGRAVADLVTVPVGTGGRITVYNGSSRPSDLLGDVVGYFRSGAPTLPGGFTAVSPARLLDTRARLGAAAPGAGATMHLPALGHAGIPSSNVSAVLLTLTQASATRTGYVTAYADGTALPATSDLNLAPGHAVANLVVAPVGPEGRIALYNGSSGTTQLVADVAGYYRGGAGSTRSALSGTVLPVVTAGYPNCSGNAECGATEVAVFDGATEVQSVSAKLSGEYEVDGLVPSDTGYTVCFNPGRAYTRGTQRYQAECFNSEWHGTEPGAGGTLVPVDPAGLRAGVDAHLSPAPAGLSTLSGRVTSQGGQPLAGVTVSAVIELPDGADMVETLGTGTTLSDGTWTISGIDPDYTFAGDTEDPSHYTTAICFTAASGSGYLDECYHDAPAECDADHDCVVPSGYTPVPIWSGRETAGVDESLAHQ